MKDWKISMPDGWRPSVCLTKEYICPSFENGTCSNEDGACPLASAVEVEPLACLADRKGVVIDGIKTNGPYGCWVILLGKICIDWPYNQKAINGDNYALAEAKARQYLNGLPDKEEK
jgi:hypothetical protein